MPKLTVLMPVYNGERYIRQAIESVLSQTFDDYEFLIIDDRSRDKTKGIILSYDDKRIRFVENRENLGQMATLNVGVKLSCGQYIARMDQDDTSLPERFKKEIDILDRFQDISLVYSDTFIIDEQGVRRNKTLFDYTKPKHSAILDNLLKRNFIAGNTVMLRRSIFEDIGFFNTAYKVAAEYDLFLRLALRHRIDFIREPLAEYRVHKENSSANAEKTAKEMVNILLNLGHHGFLEKKQKEIVSKMVSWHTANLGMSYLFQHNKKSSVGKAVEALKINPVNPKAIAAVFMASLFPNALIDYVGSFRKGWFER